MDAMSEHTRTTAITKYGLEGFSPSILAAIDEFLRLAEQNPVQAALASRLLRDVTRLSQGLDPVALAGAVEASSDHMALLRVITSRELDWAEERPLDSRGEPVRWDSRTQGTGGDAFSESTDPFYAARVRGVIARQELLSMEGGMYRGEELARELGLSRQAVDNRRRTGKLLALTRGRRGFVYPAWQVREGRVLEGFDLVLAALSDHDPWSQLSFMLTPNTWLQDESPLDVLRRGEVEPVLEAASVFGEQVAS